MRPTPTGNICHRHTGIRDKLRTRLLAARARSRAHGNDRSTTALSCLRVEPTLLGARRKARAASEHRCHASRTVLSRRIEAFHRPHSSPRGGSRPREWSQSSRCLFTSASSSARGRGFRTDIAAPGAAPAREQTTHRSSTSRRSKNRVRNTLCGAPWRASGGGDQATGSEG